MKTQTEFEIQLHYADIKGKDTEVFYSIVDDMGIADVKHLIPNHKLLVIADEMNEYGKRYIGEYFKDHLRKIVTIYLERNLAS